MCFAAKSAALSGSVFVWTSPKREQPVNAGVIKTQITKNERKIYILFMRELSTVSIFFRKYIKILHPNISNFTRIWSRIIYVKSNFKNKKRGVVMNILKKVLMVSICFTTLAILSSCGTVHGFGKDVSTVGKDIQRASR